MYEGGIRVPMAASWPGHIQPRRTPTVALTMDLYPTLCQAAGVAVPEDVDGASLLDTVVSDKPLAGRDLVWVRREGGAPYWGRDYYAIRRGNWKLLQNTPFEPYELYNLDADPLERDNLAASEPELTRDLAAALSAHVQRAGGVPWQQSH